MKSMKERIKYVSQVAGTSKWMNNGVIQRDGEDLGKTRLAGLQTKCLDRFYNPKTECGVFEMFLTYKRIDVEQTVGFVSMEFKRVIQPGNKIIYFI